MAKTANAKKSSRKSGAKKVVRRVVKKKSTTAKKSSRKTSRKTAKKASRKTAKKASRKTAKKASSKPAKKASRKTAKKASSKTAKKASRKTAKKASRKTAKAGKDYSSMLVKDLKDELRKLDLPLTGNKAELVKRLENASKTGTKKASKKSSKPAAKKASKKSSKPVAKKSSKKSSAEKGDLESMTVVQLKDILREKGLPLSGTKAVIIKRIRDSEASPEASPVASPEESPEEDEPKTLKSITQDMIDAMRLHPNKGGEYKIGDLRKIANEYGVDVSSGKGTERVRIVRALEDLVVAPEEEEEEEFEETEQEISPEPSPEPSPESQKCTDTGCEGDEVCNVDTGVCDNRKGIKTKGLYMLEYNGGVYYGSKKALNKFAKEMNISKPKLTKARKGLKTKKPKTKKVKEPIVEEVEEIEEDDFPEISVDEDEEGDVGAMAEILKEISTEKPLTKQEKEMVDKIRKCIGI